jgi:signal transduction histidine kinase
MLQQSAPASASGIPSAISRYRALPLASRHDLGPDLRNELLRCEQDRLMEAEKMAAIGMMACWISHDMRHSLSTIYANAEFLANESDTSARSELLREIQEAVLRMTDRIDSLLQFGNSRKRNPFILQRVSLILEKAIAAVKLHSDVREVSISVGKIPLVEADVDAGNLESAIYNLLLNACQAAALSSYAPEVEVEVMEIDEQICVTISDNGPGVPDSIRRALFNPFVTAGKADGIGLGLNLARRIAEEHGGSVYLVESNPGRTVFTMSLLKSAR